MIVSLKKLIIPGGWSKNMERLIVTEVILEYNVDGKNNKKRLRNFPKFLNILYEATVGEGKTFDDFLNDLRHGLRCVKNKHFKKVCLENKDK
ncbi:uncharacterized protein LOC118750631 [Rhagoletis pomonella]|uniref:uncharacterized protein LOC118750631 n=1 Tax=Rhagoletis pomonella TaxID=28610 RepID=UPI001785A384|nr:uncharacterized protein LOC118750631 [Rhagoletis pomonella]